ncbi:MAG: 4-hydroxythreonine-4-phosphate dehydrogenase PdxA [Proteobacteria bacterium]|nr:4-hydroxythreonine-4-phosphate dehydrogenase PdxA [Pseudomonadota bacterium]
MQPVIENIRNMVGDVQSPLAITMGDAAGIGPEIVAKFFAKRPFERALVVGDAGVMGRAAAKVAGAPPVIECADAAELAALNGPAIPVLSLSALPADLPIGMVDARAGKAAYDAIIAAIDLAIAGKVGGIVTAPIHKEALKAAGIRHPGHTEILAERTGTAEFGMMLADCHLRVVLVSIHVPLTEAIRLVTGPNVCRAIRLADLGTRAFGIDRPRIAVAGLNPHAGEGGLFGREDIDIIAPAVAEMQRQGLTVSGPLAPDTVFMRARNGEFDVVVAQYHDQGLIPVKYLGIEGGVNVTVGLPIIRTSVDHGTAFDIAGKGLADPGSLITAYDLAMAMRARPPAA